MQKQRGDNLKFVGAKLDSFAILQKKVENMCTATSRVEN
jgi:hypothetical protein